MPEACGKPIDQHTADREALRLRVQRVQHDTPARYADQLRASAVCEVHVVQFQITAYGQCGGVGPAVLEVQTEVQFALQRSGVHEILQIRQQLRQCEVLQCGMHRIKRSLRVDLEAAVECAATVQREAEQEIHPRTFRGDEIALHVQPGDAHGRLQHVAIVYDAPAGDADVHHTEAHMRRIRGGRGIRSAHFEQVAEVEAVRVLRDVEVGILDTQLAETPVLVPEPVP